MLTAPGRILWYVSGRVGEVVAVSHLDEVELDRPKSLYRKYQKLGILEWKDIYQFCGQDIDKEIMALRFSRTFMFRRRIPLSELRDALGKERIGESLQSPSNVPYALLVRLFNIGFPATK